MTAERDNPRGPTSEQLRRRVLAHEATQVERAADDQELLAEWESRLLTLPPGSGPKDGYAQGLSEADAERWRRRWDAVPWPPPDPHA